MSSDRRHPPLGIELVIYTKDGGPLTKKISLGSDGKISGDNSACTMVRGKAKRKRLDGWDDFAELIVNLHSNEALGLGTLRPDLPDEVSIVIKKRVGDGSGVIARTRDNFAYRSDKPALTLLDFDTKGMTPEVARKIAEHGGFWPALVSVLPALEEVAHLIRKSTSAGLSRSDTGEEFPGSGGLHVYIIIKDGDAAERFLKTLHERCWLAGFGWMMIDKAGRLLERSLVDRTVWAPERLAFEGPPVVEPPLSQDQAGRRPVVIAGEMMDSIAACKPLTVVERQTYERMKAVASQALAGESRRVKESYIANRQQRMMLQQTGMTADAARAVIEKQISGVLLASFELLFVDPELEGKTVGDVLDNPGLFEGKILADPIETEFNCAMVMVGADGYPFINSFAHGHAFYRLKYDAAAIRSRIAVNSDPVGTFIKLALMADLDEIETTKLTHDVARRSGVGVRDIKATLKVDEK